MPKAKDPKDPTLNPLTGKPANSYTQVTNRDLPAPVAVREVDSSSSNPYAQHQEKKYAQQRKSYEKSQQGPFGDKKGGFEEVGYQMDAIKPQYKDWMLAMPKYLAPRAPGGPAINEPHEVGKHVPLTRRREDLSGAEDRKAVATAKQFGTTPEKMASDSMHALHSAARRNIDAYSSPENTPGRGFYGGPSAPVDVLHMLGDKIKSHPNFSGSAEDSAAIAAGTTSATSPRNPFEQVSKKTGVSRFPNNISATAASMHALDGNSASQKVVGGGSSFPANLEKAVHITNQIAGGSSIPEVHNPSNGDRYFDWTTKSKTASFVGAMIEPSGPDSANTNDVNHISAVMPHLSSAKSHVFNVTDSAGAIVKGSDGKAIRHTIDHDDTHPGTGLPTRKVTKMLGLEPGQKLQHSLTKIGTHEASENPSEMFLKRGGHTSHALTDWAARTGYSAAGAVKDKDHAQATHGGQEVIWREKQISNPKDTSFTNESAYPDAPTISPQFHISKLRKEQ